MLKKLTMLLAVLGLLLLGTAQAQPEVARAQLRERLRVAMLKRLVDRLGIDAQTAVRMGQIAKNFDDQLAAVQADNGRTRRELKRLTEGPALAGGSDDASINRLSDKIIAGRTKMAQLEQGRTAELRKVMKPIDYARLLLVWPQVNREMKAEIYRALGNGNGRGMPGGGAPEEE